MTSPQWSQVNLQGAKAQQFAFCWCSTRWVWVWSQVQVWSQGWVRGRYECRSECEYQAQLKPTWKMHTIWMEWDCTEQISCAIQAPSQHYTIPLMAILEWSAWQNYLHDPFPCPFPYSHCSCSCGLSSQPKHGRYMHLFWDNFCTTKVTKYSEWMVCSPVKIFFSHVHFLIFFFSGHLVDIWPTIPLILHVSWTICLPWACCSRCFWSMPMPRWLFAPVSDIIHWKPGFLMASQVMPLGGRFQLCRPILGHHLSMRWPTALDRWPWLLSHLWSQLTEWVHFLPHVVNGCIPLN
jgi:hypothetical protein